MSPTPRRRYVPGIGDKLTIYPGGPVNQGAGRRVMGRQMGAARQARWCALGWMFFLALSLAGCGGGPRTNTNGGSRATDDPILGPAKPGASSGGSAAGQPLSPLPALPSPNGSTSAAALATGTNSQLDNRG